MAKTFNTSRVNTLPSSGKNGDQYFLRKPNGRYEQWMVVPNGSLEMLKGITDAEQSRVDRLNDTQVTKLEQLDTQAESDAKFDAYKEEVDDKIQEGINLSNAGIYPLGNATVLPVPPMIEVNGEMVEMSTAYAKLKQDFTYTQAGGPDIIPTVGHDNWAFWEGTVWTHVDMGEISRLSLEDTYVPQFLVNLRNPYSLRINDVPITYETLIFEWLKKLDESIQSLKVFGLKDNYLGIRQFTYNSTTKVISIAFNILEDLYGANDVTNTAFTGSVTANSDGIVYAEAKQRYTPFSCQLVMDVTPFGDNNIAINFRGADNLAYYKNIGIKNSSITRVHAKSIWNTSGWLLNNNSETAGAQSLHINEAIKDFKVKSLVPYLVQLTQINYNAESGNIQFIINFCLHTDPSNLTMTDRQGSGYLRINVPWADTGEREYTSYVLSTGSNGEEATKNELQATMVLDMDYFKANLPIPTDIAVSVGNSTLCNFISKPVTTVSEDAIAKYAFLIKDLGYNFFVDNINPPTLRANGVDVTDAATRIRILHKLDKCFLNITAFNLEPNVHVAIRQFTYTPETGTFSLGLSTFSTVDQDETMNVVFKSFSGVDFTKPFYFKMGNVSFTKIYKVGVDFSNFGEDAIAMNFRRTGEIGNYQTSGIKMSAITIEKPKSFWGYISGYTLYGTQPEGANRAFASLFHDAVKDITVTSQANDLVRISAVSWDATNARFAVVIMACTNNDATNLKVTTGRAGFSYLRINIPFSDTGLRIYDSFRLSGATTTQMRMVIDLDILRSEFDYSQIDVRLTNMGELATWIATGGTIPPTPTPGLDELTMIAGTDATDIEGNYRFASAESTNWAVSESHTMYKLSRIPDNTEEIVVTGQIDAELSKLIYLDKNLQFIRLASPTPVTNLVDTVPTNAVFIRVATTSPTSTFKVVARGDFATQSGIRDYRSITEGLADKFSGIEFRVNGFLFTKNHYGLCTISEYTTPTTAQLQTLPMLEKDGEPIVNTGILYTDGASTYNGGSLCAIKDGVMYFYNARACAIYKSADGGNTFTTICDKFSHPSIWDTEDVGTESRSAIVVLDNGELLFPVRHRGTIDIDPERTTRKQRYYILCKTTGGQTNVEKCFSFSHEDSTRTWLPENDPQRNWPNHAGGCMLGDFTHATNGSFIIITEYGTGTSAYWNERGVANNARGVSGKAWASNDYGLTWYKVFDGDRKKVGTAETDDNWYYFTSTNSAKMRHMHGVDIDVARGVVHLTNGDNEDYIWTANISDIIAFINSPTTTPVDPAAENIFTLPTDTYPTWDAKLILPAAPGKTNDAYSVLRAQMMKAAPVQMGHVWGHDASREFVMMSYYSGGEFIYEPVATFEVMEDFATIQDFVASWSSTDAFVQGITIHDGVIYMTHSSKSGNPSRIWATIDGLSFRPVYVGDYGDIGFGSPVIFDDNGDAYLPYLGVDYDSRTAGYRKLRVQ